MYQALSRDLRITIKVEQRNKEDRHNGQGQLSVEVAFKQRRESEEEAMWL